MKRVNGVEESFPPGICVASTVEISIGQQGVTMVKAKVVESDDRISDFYEAADPPCGYCMDLERRRVSLTSKAAGVISFGRICSNVRSTAMVRTSSACSVFRPSCSLNCVSGSSICNPALCQCSNSLATNAQSIVLSVFSSEIGRYAPGALWSCSPDLRSTTIFAPFHWLR